MTLQNVRKELAFLDVAQICTGVRKHFKCVHFTVLNVSVSEKKHLGKKFVLTNLRSMFFHCHDCLHTKQHDFVNDFGPQSKIVLFLLQ